MLYEFIKDNYTEGEPIFITDIELQGMSEVNLRQQFKVLTDSGRLMRYAQGIYYMQHDTILKGAATLSADTVAYYRYICRNNQVDGYYSGYTFANQLGLSMQVPVTTEIVSNNIAAKKRDIVIGNRTFIVRHSHIKVTNENNKVLQFLDLLKNLKQYADDNESVAERLVKHIRDCNITRADIDKYIFDYPDVTFRNFYEMRLDYVFA